MNATRIAAVLVFAVFAVTATVAAQPGPPPVAKEMAKYDALLGHWEGAGVVRPAPGGPEMPWTSTATTKAVLGGHFVMDQMKIEVEGMPVPLVIQSVTGWDHVTGTYVSFEIGNAGQAAENTVRRVGNKFITTSSGVEDGAAVADHWVTEVDGDEVRFTGRRSIDGGPFFVHVEGRATRGGAGFSMGPESAAYALTPPNEHLEPLRVLVGTWSFRGEWKPAPAAEAVPLTGREKIDAILGGHVISARMKGAGGGIDYEAINLIAWSDAENCILTVGFNNMGEHHTAKCWIEGDRLLSVSAGAMMGRPTANRGIMTMSENEILIEGHMTAGTDEPYLSFKATSTRVEGAGPRR